MRQRRLLGNGLRVSPRYCQPSIKSPLSVSEIRMILIQLKQVLLTSPFGITAVRLPGATCIHGRKPDGRSTAGSRPRNRFNGHPKTELSAISFIIYHPSPARARDVVFNIRVQRQKRKSLTSLNSAFVQHTHNGNTTANNWPKRRPPRRETIHSICQRVVH
jgi:hypothetical protein